MKYEFKHISAWQCTYCGETLDDIEDAAGCEFIPKGVCPYPDTQPRLEPEDDKPSGMVTEED